MSRVVAPSPRHPTPPPHPGVRVEPRSTHPDGPGQFGHLSGLIWTLIRTEFKTRYHGTLGGFVWALLKPLAMFVVLWTVFSFIFHTEPHYKLNLILGLFLYDFFSEGTKTGLAALRSKGYLLTKARFPSWILIVTSTSNAVITLFFFSLAMVTLLVLDGRPPGPLQLSLYSVYAFALLLIIVGFSLAASVLFLRYRDLNQVWEVVAQAGFFVAPVVYPLGILPERVHFLIYLWLPTPVMQFARAALVDGTVPTLRAHLYLGIEVAVILAAGTLVYRRFAPRAAEYL